MAIARMLGRALAALAMVVAAAVPAAAQELNLFEMARQAGVKTQAQALYESPRDPFAWATRKAGEARAMQAEQTCRTRAQTFKVPGSSVAEYRCGLVAYETCMNAELGLISQSQDTGKQCTIIRGLAGDGACAQPCADAAKLPRGGNRAVTLPSGRSIGGLTEFAAACHQEILSKGGGPEAACMRNQALQCLINASADPAVNQAIRDERRAACRSWHDTHPGESCSACNGVEPRVDFDSRKIDLDPEHCNAKLAAQGQCVMPGR